jgi:hypothetical protein
MPAVGVGGVVRGGGGIVTANGIADKRVPIEYRVALMDDGRSLAVKLRANIVTRGETAASTGAALKILETWKTEDARKGGA